MGLRISVEVSLTYIEKIKWQFACPTAGDHCHVRLLGFYVSKLPKGAKEKDAFYFTPLSKTPEDPEKPWYSVGHFKAQVHLLVSPKQI